MDIKKTIDVVPLGSEAACVINHSNLILTMRRFIILICAVTLPISALAKNKSAILANGHYLGFTAEENPFLKVRVEEDQLFLDIPKEVLDLPVLFVRYGLGSDRKFIQVVWSLQGDKMLLKMPAIRSTAGITIPIKPKLSLTDNILAVFPLEKGKEQPGTYTVNITDLVLQQMIEWEPGFSEQLAPEISLLMGAKNMADEVVIKTRRGLVKDGSKVSIPIFYGFAPLPDPMKARRFDYRMGFYDEENTGIHFQLRNSLANIARWRLEKKYKDQEVSVPVKPITFLLSPEIPKKWRPYVKAGIEEWLPAFESAGFKDALVVKELDSLDEWTAHSIHSNIVYWPKNKYMRGREYEDYGGTVANIIDLRTGEILRGDIFIGVSERTAMEKYFVRAAPLDKRAQQFPFPDEITGSMFQVTAAHEAGHVFGLKDANYGEYAYPWEKMNDSVWLRTMGHTPSIMNYTRPSNIPQPEDSIPPHLLFQRVGPADRYNIRWAYTEFPEEMSLERENRALEKMIRWQDSVPWYRFINATFEVIGPGASNEVVETNDPVRSTELALKNLERVVALLPKATEDQNDNTRLERLYEKTLELWYNHMVHVSTLIGGYDIQYKPLGQGGKMYTPIPWEKQMEALDFLLVNAFDPPKWLTYPSFHINTRYSTFPDKVSEYQQRLLPELLMAPRLKRLEYMESGLVTEHMVQIFLNQLQSGLFLELQSDIDSVDGRRQALHILYIGQLIRSIQQKRPGLDPGQRFYAHSDYIKAQALGQLMDLKKEIQKGLKKKWDVNSKAHWQRCLLMINGV